MNPIRLFIFINIIFLMGCRSLEKKESIDLCSNTRLPCLANTENVLLVTNQGKIKLELYGKMAPLTVGNFIDLVEKGKYNNTNFNMVIREPVPLVIRVGNSKINTHNESKDKNISKIRYIPLEIKLKSDQFPIYGKVINEASKILKIELRHNRGSLSMARSKGLNSANSQFYISLKSLPELDGRYAVFGKVSSGMNVIDLIQEEDFIIEAIRL